MIVPAKTPCMGTCVVLGGRGFLGRSLVTRLLHLGEWIVKVADSQPLQLDPSSDSLLSSAVESGQASFCQVDVRDVSQICRAIRGAFVVFFMEPSDLDINDFCNCYMIIVQGTINVIKACRECRVRRLVYNSSVDVVFDGSQDIHNGDESLTCLWKFQDMLIDFKVQAEGLILSANNIDGLLTCALRPSDVFGPCDAQLVPLLVNLAKCGLGKFIIGNGENKSDFTYAENVAHAYVSAAEALDSRVVSVAGKVFLITNLEPMMFWEFVSHVLEGLGYQRPFVKLPTKIVWYILLVVKWMQEKLHIRFHRCDLIWRIRITLSSFEISETVMRDSIRCIASERNRGACTIRSLAKGEDWNTFLKVAGSLYIFKFLLLYSFTVLIGMTQVFAFIAFFIYEQYEFEIDGLAKFFSNSFMTSKGLLMRNLPAPVASYLHNFTTPHQPKSLSMVKTQKEL